jgi:hypothetical protein
MFSMPRRGRFSMKGEKSLEGWSGRSTAGNREDRCSKVVRLPQWALLKVGDGVAEEGNRRRRWAGGGGGAEENGSFNQRESGGSKDGERWDAWKVPICLRRTLLGCVKPTRVKVIFLPCGGYEATCHVAAAERHVRWMRWDSFPDEAKHGYAISARLRVCPVQLLVGKTILVICRVEQVQIQIIFIDLCKVTITIERIIINHGHFRISLSYRCLYDPKQCFGLSISFRWHYQTL